MLIWQLFITKSQFYKDFISILINVNGKLGSVGVVRSGVRGNGLEVKSRGWTTFFGSRVELEEEDNLILLV